MYAIRSYYACLTQPGLCTLDLRPGTATVKEGIIEPNSGGPGVAGSLVEFRPLVYLVGTKEIRCWNVSAFCLSNHGLKGLDPRPHHSYNFV